MIKVPFILISLFFIHISCKSRGQTEISTRFITTDSLEQVRYQKLLEYPLDSTSIPRSYENSTKKTRGMSSTIWTSGFFPGNLWQLFLLTKDPEYKQRAAAWTSFLEKEKNDDKSHDIGFKIICSYGKGYNITGNNDYKNIIVQSAKTLTTRFNKKIGSLRSWDSDREGWEFPVIIDNMMNLELLFEATKLSKDSTFYNIAVAHADMTLKNHIRENNSIYHVVLYDTTSGEVMNKITHQGFNDQSAWARGQAWGIYGFTMAYRYTKNPKYLNQAVATADFYLSHKNLPDDGIPYWDFDDPKIPNAPRDVSAATIISSAFFELHEYIKYPKYIEYADKVLNTLKSNDYLLDAGVDTPFILDHSTGNWPANDEINVPIVYADYYYLEALLRKKQD